MDVRACSDELQALGTAPMDSLNSQMSTHLLHLSVIAQSGIRAGD